MSAHSRFSLRRALGRTLGLRRPMRADADMDDEIQFHLAERVDQLVASGWSPEDARAEAVRRFGPFDETMRGLRRAARQREEKLQMMERIREFTHDIRIGARTLRRYPAFALTAVFTLAAGVGAACSIFGVVEHTLLHPLPYAAPDRLLFIAEQFKTGDAMLVSYPNFVDWRERTRTMDAVEAVGVINSGVVLGGDEPVFAHIQNVSRGLLPMLGVKPIVGRWIAPDENRAGATSTVMVSEDFWRNHLGAQSNLASIKLSVYGTPRSVVGVMPRSFSVFDRSDVWFPLEVSPVKIRAAGNYWVIGRLKPGVSLDAARKEMNDMAAHLKATYGDDSFSSAVVMERLRDHIIGGARKPLLFLLASAAFVLLVTCVNVAMMLLARGTARSRELAVRTALGAGQWRLIGQAVAETSILVAGGIAGGLIIAWRGIALIKAHGAGLIPRINELSFDGRVALAAATIAVAVTIVFSLIPAIAARRVARDALASASARASRPSGTWTLLLGLQSAATVVLVLGAGLVVRTVSNIVHTDAGYDPRDVTAAIVPLTSKTYSEDATRERAGAQLEQALSSALPGSVVGLASSLPTDRGSGGGPLLLPPIINPSSQKEWVAFASTREVTPGYFRALRIPLLRGRMFDEDDRDGAPDVALVNASLARKLWPGQDPIGKRVRAFVDPRGALFTVVGVVGDARDWRRAPGTQIELYLPFAQRPASFVAVVVRSTAPAATVASAMRRIVHDLDPNVPARVISVTDAINDTMADRRFIAGMLLAFASVVVVLTMMGTFGAQSYAVALRRREIGIRLAIGATPRHVWLGVERQTLTTAAMGAVIGVVVAWSATRAVSRMLYGISPHDPLTFAVAPAVVCLIGVLAAAVPAMRAARTDPSTSLRTE